MVRKVGKSDGFSDWVSESDGGGLRKTADLGVHKETWPSAEKMQGMLKQGADVARTSIQFLDPAYFDPILFFVQHRDRKELNFRLRYYTQYHCALPGTIVFSDKGAVPIESISTLDKVVDSRGHYQPVQGTERNFVVDATVLTIKPYGLPEFQVTNEHQIPVLCRCGEQEVRVKVGGLPYRQRIKATEVVFVKAEDLDRKSVV